MSRFFESSWRTVRLAVSWLLSWRLVRRQSLCQSLHEQLEQPDSVLNQLGLGRFQEELISNSHS